MAAFPIIDAHPPQCKAKRRDGMAKMTDKNALLEFIASGVLPRLRAAPHYESSSAKKADAIETQPENAAPITDKEAAADGRAVVNLFRHWKLTDAEARKLLGDMPSKTWARWKTGDVGQPSQDIQLRLGTLLGIHTALRCIYSEPEHGYEWIRTPKKAFCGKSALDVMKSGKITDLAQTRNYLDGERGAY